MTLGKSPPFSEPFFLCQEERAESIGADPQWVLGKGLFSPSGS